MPVLNLPGLPPLSMTDTQVQQFMAQNPGLAPLVRQQLGLSAPATTSTSRANAGNTLGRKKPADPNRPATDPCTLYETNKRQGTNAAVLEVLRQRCQAYQEAQAFAGPSTPLNEAQLAAMASSEVMPEEQGMSKGLKIGLAVAGGALVLGGLYYFMTRR